MMYRGAPIEGNKFNCIVLASIFENDWYGESYDPDSPTPPSCYAFSKTQDGLAPHAEAEDKQGDANGLCAGCWANGFGSGTRDGKPSRGKACQNRRRLALIPVSKDMTAESAKAAEIAYIRVPVMSTPGWSNHVTAISDTYKLPAFGVITEVSLVPDPKSTFRMVFKPIAKLARDILGSAFERAKLAEKSIEFPYPKASEIADDRQQQPARRRVVVPKGKKAAAKKNPQAARDNALPTGRRQPAAPRAPAAAAPRKF